jgi:DNA polymerase I-like protein with 3'-5' exonuclease and polymerase domains
MGTAVPITIDFETKPIESRPDYPPVPVGVAFWWPGGRPYYLAWGHAAGGNNSTKAEARKHLTKAWRSGRPLLFHNCKFDLAVAEAFFARSIPPWERVHDTTFLAFLDDPNSQKVSLKPLAERLLGMKQEEKDAVDEWLKKHGPPEVRRLGPKKRGAHLWLAPGDLVADYAIGDVVRTRKLYEYFVPRIRKASMEEVVYTSDSGSRISTSMRTKISRMRWRTPTWWRSGSLPRPGSVRPRSTTSRSAASTNLSSTYWSTARSSRTRFVPSRVPG